MKVVLHTFGTKQDFYLQSSFLIINLLQFRDSIDSINVITEKPEYYRRFENYINLIGVDEKTIIDWKGQSGFLYRVKLKALETVLTRDRANQPLLYLDADTFVYQNFNELKDSVLQGNGIMYLNEGKLSRCPTHSGQRMWRKIKHQSFGGNIITENDCMWNAGVVGIPADKCHQIIETSLMMCDEMCRRIPVNFLIEQFCVSVTLQRLTEMKSATEWIGHYWANWTGWNQLIYSFIAESFMKDYSVEQDIERMSKFNFRQIPIALIPSNTEIKLNQLVSRIFRPKLYANIDWQQ